MDEKTTRELLVKSLSWGEAHADWNHAIENFPANLRGVRPKGCPHSAWELLEHARIAQHDILEFCRNPKHESPDWPSGYWPATPEPRNAAAWDKSWKHFQRDNKEMADLIADPETDLTAPIAHGSGQTILREVLLVVDHNSYHLGQLVLVRRMVDAWSKM